MEDEIDLTSSNRNLASHLATIASYYFIQRDRFRAKTFSDAAKLIAEYPFTIVSGPHARQTIPRVGPSLMEVIDQYFETGTSQRLTDLESLHKERKEVVDQMLDVYGIGPVLANRYYDLGFRTLADLWYEVPLCLASEFGVVVENVRGMARQLGIIEDENVLLEHDELTNLFYTVLKRLAERSRRKYPSLTSAQRIGLEYRSDFKLKIPRSEIDQIYARLVELLPEDLEFIIAGSYRRGEAESGDVDVLVKSKPGVDLDAIIDFLTDEDLLIGDLARGASKYMGVLRLADTFPARRIDVLVVPLTGWAYATLYFTGSARFNVLSRQRAIDLGLRLNEHGMTDAEGRSYPASSEEDIFEHLDLQYLEPEERTRSIPSLS